MSQRGQSSGYARRFNAASHYLNGLRRAGVEPNHFIAPEYLAATDWTITNGMVLDEEGFVFPPLVNGGLVGAQCLVDFEGLETSRPRRFFDYEFIYRAGSFRDLSGGALKTFRKNCRRIEAQDPTYKSVSSSQALDVFLEWAEGKTVEDLHTIVRYLDHAKPEGLFVGKQLVGFNAWDCNWRFINFRYSFTFGEERGLSEYLRLMFYLSLPETALVNDGGALGSEGLERFKRKLGPVEVRRRSSIGYFGE